MNTSLLKKTIVAALFAGTICRTEAALKLGDAMPDLPGYKLKGKLPESLKGKVVILDFWASWCGPCKQSFPAMNELQRKYADKGLVIIAINEDELAGDMNDFLKENPALFSVVRDADQTFVAAAGVATLPGSFIFDREGKVKFIHAGFDPGETRKQYIDELESLLKK